MLQDCQILFLYNECNWVLVLEHAEDLCWTFEHCYSLLTSNKIV